MQTIPTEYLVQLARDAPALFNFNTAGFAWMSAVGFFAVPLRSGGALLARDLLRLVVLEDFSSSFRTRGFFFLFYAALPSRTNAMRDFFRSRNDFCLFDNLRICFLLIRGFLVTLGFLVVRGFFFKD